MFPLKVELRNFGITHFLVSPHGQPYPVFLNLAVDLRKRLKSPLDNIAVIDEALRQHWVIIQLNRITAQSASVTQRYRVRVQAERRTFGGKIRTYPATGRILRQLEQELAQRLPVLVELLDFSKGNRSIIQSEFASSGDFARIFLHTIAAYNNPLERQTGREPNQ